MASQTAILLEDAILVDRLQSGDIDAFAELIDTDPTHCPKCQADLLLTIDSRNVARFKFRIEGGVIMASSSDFFS